MNWIRLSHRSQLNMFLKMVIIIIICLGLLLRIQSFTFWRLHLEPNPSVHTIIAFNIRNEIIATLPPSLSHSVCAVLYSNCRQHINYSTFEYFNYNGLPHFIVLPNTHSTPTQIHSIFHRRNIKFLHSIEQQTQIFASIPNEVDRSRCCIRIWQ